MRNIDKVNTALVRTPKSTCNDLSSWVETTEEDSARQSIYKNVTFNSKKTNQFYSQDKENAPDYRPDVKTAISNTPKKKEDNEKKAEDSKNDSWGSLSAFNDPSSRKSNSLILSVKLFLGVYKRDSDSQLPTAKLDKINVVEAAVETISSDCTNLRTELSDGHPSLVQDLKAKKKVNCC